MPTLKEIADEKRKAAMMADIEALWKTIETRFNTWDGVSSVYATEEREKKYKCDCPVLEVNTEHLEQTYGIDAFEKLVDLLVEEHPEINDLEWDNDAGALRFFP